MDLEAALRSSTPTKSRGLTPLFPVIVALPALLGAAHHVDHIVRGNHVGWPIIAEVTPFTYSLVIYPILAVGLYLTATGRAGTRFWTGFFAFSTGMLAYFHLSPWAVEPPADVIVPYADPAVGFLAFGVLLGLIASVGFGTVYMGRLWLSGVS